MTREAAIMYAVAGIAALSGTAALWRLRRPHGELQRYALLMVGIMALALGLILAIFATAQHRWSLEP